MLKRTLAGLVAAAVMASGAIAGPLEEGLAAYQCDDYATALRLIRPLAEKNEARLRKPSVICTTQDTV